MTDFIPYPGSSPLRNYVRLLDSITEDGAHVKVVVTSSANNAASDTATDTDEIGETFIP